jgi:hypothetical protein
MGTTDHDTQRARSESGTPDEPDAAAALATGAASDHPLGSHAAQILATEHWSLLAARTLIWNEAMSRANVFLTVLSAAIIALALLADATGFGRQTTTLALVVLLLGVATYVRQVQINNEEFKLVLAMNRLRHAYLKLEPGRAVPHHRPPRRRARPVGHLHARPSQPAMAAGAFHDQHAHHRGDRGRGPGGCHRRAGPADRRGGDDRDGCRWGGGVPGCRGRADAAAAAHRGSAPPRAAEVPHPTAGTVGHGAFVAEPLEATQLRS